MSVDPTTIPTKQLRSFGWLMGWLFLVIGLWPLVVHGAELRSWSAGVAGLWGAMALAWPKGLTPLYRGWMWFAEKLGWFNTRVLLGVIYYVLVTPLSLLMRMLGKKPLQCSFDQQKQSYREIKAVRTPGSCREAILRRRGVCRNLLGNYGRSCGNARSFGWRRFSLCCCY